MALTLREVCGLTTEEIARALPAERLETVLQVIYLVFKEGYAPAAGDTLTRPDLSAEAPRLGHLLLALLRAPRVQGAGR